MKRRLMVLGLSGALLGAGLVGAQQSSGATPDDPATQAAAPGGQEPNAQRAAMVAQMLLHRPLDMGSTLTVTLFDGDPEAGGTELSSLEFVYGEDSEAAFAEQIKTAATDAAYVTVTTSPQTETYDLSEMEPGGPGRFGGTRFGNRGLGGFDPEGFNGHHR